MLNRYHMFLWRNHKNINTVFRLVHPVYDMDKRIFKVTVSIKQAKSESNLVFYPPPPAYSTSLGPRAFICRSPLGSSIRF